MKNLTTGNIYKTFFMFGFPVCLSGLLSQLYNVIDTIIVGQFIGETGLAAIGATSPLITLISSLFWGYLMGLGIYVARLYGAGEVEKIKSTILHAFSFCVAVCFLITALFAIFYKPIFSLLNIPLDIYEETKKYFITYSLCVSPIILSAGFSLVMHSFGISVYPLALSIISSVLNIIGNIVSIVVLNLGVFGVALSSGISATIICILYTFKLRKTFKEIGANNYKVELSFKVIKDTFPYVLPICLQQAILYVSGCFISPLVNDLGEEASASYAVCLQIFNICATIFQNSSKTLSNYASQCLGMNKPEKINKGILVGLIQSVVFVTPFALFFILFNKTSASLFIKNDASAATKEYIFLFLKYFMPLIYFNMFANLFHSLWRGVKAMGHLCTSAGFASVARYVITIILIKNYGMTGFFLGWALSWVLESIFIVILFYIGKWRPTVTKTQV